MWRVYFFFFPYLSVYVRTYTLDTYAYASARLPVCVWRSALLRMLTYVRDGLSGTLLSGSTRFGW